MIIIIFPIRISCVMLTKAKYMLKYKNGEDGRMAL